MFDQYRFIEWREITSWLGFLFHGTLSLGITTKQLYMQIFYLNSEIIGMKRRVGCILVNNRRVIATGYNGTPRGIRNCNQGGCQRCNSNASCGSLLDTCLCLHAEEVYFFLWYF